MKRNLVFLSLLALVCLNGCVSSSFFEPTPLANPANALVYVYRPAAPNPGKKPLTMSYPEVMLDGASVGLLKYNEYLALEITPGQREFLVTGLTRDAKWEPRDRSYTLKVESGKSYFLRYRVEFDTAKMSLGTFKGQYIINFQPVNETDAVYEIRHTSKAGK